MSGPVKLGAQQIVPETFKDPLNDGITIGSSSTQIFAENLSRRYLAIVNDSDEVIYLALGTAAVMNKGIRINAQGGSYELEEDTPVYKGIINGICASGSKVVTIVEGT